uniref:Transmembrane protein 44 n=1 Tax=Oryzias melastigma TaxID=30732 RepID=A0A3B3DZ48_ORYME
MFFSTSDRRLRMAKRRRRQHLLAVGVLMVVAGGFLKSRVTEPPSFRSVRGRKLLHSGLQPPSWSLEILGYTLGLLSFVIACTSRFPALCRAKFTRSYIFSRLLCSVSGALYTAAILLYNTQFGFLLRVLPWLLSATSCVLLDLIQISLKEAMMGKERVEGGALCSRVRLVRAGSLCSSDTSYDSSADSSDLEVGWTADEPQKSNFNLYV